MGDITFATLLAVANTAGRPRCLKRDCRSETASHRKHYRRSSTLTGGGRKTGGRCRQREVLHRQREHRGSRQCAVSPGNFSGLKLAVAFVGRPDTANLLAVLRSGLTACVTVAVPLAPAAVAVTLP